MRRRFWFIRCALLAVTLAGLAALMRIDFSRKVSTDVLDLIPAAERNPELAIVRSLANETSARVALFAIEVPGDAERRETVGKVFAAKLRESAAFAEVVPMTDTASREELGRHVFAQRFDLLLPGWLADRRREYVAEGTKEHWPDWLATHVAKSLEGYLSRPEALAFQDILPADPLLLVPGMIDRMPALQTPSGGDQAVLIWARTAASPLSEAGQVPVFAAVDAALTAARSIEPRTQLRWTSIARFAAESRRRIEKELGGLNLLSLVAVFVVGAVGLRRLYKAAHLIPVVLGGLLGAWLATLLCFDRVHVLVFVVGSLLAGVAVDYGFYLSLQPPAYPDEPYASRVRRLLKPLLASALTTILGFSLLLFSDLPLIQQLGVFVSAGLLSSLATALLWFAQVPRPFVETRAFIRARAARTDFSRRVAWLILTVAALVAASGPWLLRWRDDVRELEIPAPQLRAEAAAVQSLFGDAPGRVTYLTYGESVRAARDRLDQFQQWHARQRPDVPLASLGFVLPTGADYDALGANLEGLDDFPARLARELEQRGFTADAFEPFRAAWATWRAKPPLDYGVMAARLSGSLHGPLSLLMSSSSTLCWFSSIASDASPQEPPAATATVSVRQLENLNRLFTRYRVSALHLSSIGLLALGLSVLALYGVSNGWRIFAVPAGACLFAFGVFGLTGQTLNLFHLLGAFLGVCLSHNYAIFSAENALRREESPPSVRLSALTTAASFGVLALSQIPVVAALGLTVAFIVLTALVIVEVEPLAHRPSPANPPPPFPR